MTAGQPVIQCSLWNTGFLGNHCDGGCARLTQTMQNLFALRVRLSHCLNSCAPNYEQGSGHFDLNRGAPITDQLCMEFIAFLESSIGRAGRNEALRAYCTVSLVPGESRSLEPMAARIDPAHVRQLQRAKQHCTAEASWDDRAVLRAIRQDALPIIENTGLIEAGIILETRSAETSLHRNGLLPTTIRYPS
jgi:hypothetical protein